MLQSVSWSDLARCLAGTLLDEIAAHVAHEVNNPLAVISGTAEQLGNILHSPPGGEAALERVSEIVLRNANRIKATTRALQELARETNSAPYQEARLSDLLGAAASLCHASQALADVRLDLPECPEDAYILCSPPAIVFALTGLFECSARLAGKTGSTAVTALVEYAVKEYRIAAMMSYDPLLLETLTALSATLSIEGALTFDEWWDLRIAKKIARAHKGDITIVGGGSKATVALTLPAR